MIIWKIAVLVVSLSVVAADAEAQRYNSQVRRSRIATPYFYGGARGYPAGYGSRSAYRLSPYINRAPVIGTPALPPVTGPVERYSPVEYGEIVQMAIEAARQNSPSGATTTTRRSIVDETTASLSGETAYKPVATGVSDILDRGILLLPTGEELRLRGVSIPSTTDRNEVSRLYAREALELLRNLTTGKEVYIVLDNPLRDSDGRLLGTVILADGTELNRIMLEKGYGSLNADDFATAVDFSDLTSAQELAKKSRVGIWSKGY